MMAASLKTSAIILRVADFLKAFPPFSYLADEALLELARSGRVQFCEKGEILFDQGTTHGRYFYVINKGSVRLVRGEDQKLSDLRGPGDFVGAGAVLGEAAVHLRPDVPLLRRAPRELTRRTVDVGKFRFNL